MCYVWYQVLVTMPIHSACLHPCLHPCLQGGERDGGEDAEGERRDAEGVGGDETDH